MIRKLKTSVEMSSEKGKVASGAKTRRITKAIRELVTRLGPIIALVLLASYLAIVSPYFLKTSNIVNITRQSAITAILSVGQSLVILTAGIDLSVGAIVAISASAAAGPVSNSAVDHELKDQSRNESHRSGYECVPPVHRPRCDLS